jgi:hypothetical protein
MHVPSNPTLTTVPCEMLTASELSSVDATRMHALKSRDMTWRLRAPQQQVANAALPKFIQIYTSIEKENYLTYKQYS